MDDIQIQNKYMEVSYQLFVPNETGNWDMVEQTTPQRPFKFISGIGIALEAFEKQLEGLVEGATFDFQIPIKDAYGEYTDEHVLSLKKDIFCINGKFDDARIYPGNVVPLANEDGNRFDGIVREVRDDVVVMDLNHPLAGKPLHFKGTVLVCHDATKEELEYFLQQFGEEDDHCCCGHDHDDCDCHHEGEGCDHHHHESHCGCGHCH